jgi:hypothetical protein
MKKALLSMMLLALTTAAGTSAVFAQTPNPPTSKASPAETEVRRANTEEVDAFLHNDPTAMDRLWSEDFVVTNPLNKFVTKRSFARTQIRNRPRSLLPRVGVRYHSAIAFELATNLCPVGSEPSY